MRNDILERVPVSLSTNFLALFFSKINFIIHYIENSNLIYTLDIMVKSAQQKKKSTVFKKDMA